MTFYGFAADIGNWANVGLMAIITFDRDCVEVTPRIRSSSFPGSKKEEILITTEMEDENSNEVDYENSNEEACYTYGTTVVRRSPEGKNETIAIEDVKEGEYILTKGI